MEPLRPWKVRTRSLRTEGSVRTGKGSKPQYLLMSPSDLCFVTNIHCGLLSIPQEQHKRI